jgi:hypothetical protein
MIRASAPARLGLISFCLLLVGVGDAAADFVITTNPGNGETLNYGYTLVATTKELALSATNDGSDSGGVGFFAAVNHSPFGPTTAYAFTLGYDPTTGKGETVSRQYTYAPTIRGQEDVWRTAVFYGTPGNPGISAATVRLYGQGVAPVSAPIDQTGNGAGYTLVGYNRAVTIGIGNIGDGNLSGLGAVSNLNGTMATGAGAFSLTGSNAISVKDGAQQTFTYSYNPNKRGDDLANLTANFINGSADNTNQAHSRDFQVKGTGVAPVNQFSQADAGLTRIGTTSLASVQITNVGDGNKSGLGSISNLNGSITALNSSGFSGAGGSFSLTDNANHSFNYFYTPNQHSVNTGNVGLNFLNGSADATNHAQNVNLSLMGQGVGPIFASSATPGSLLNFGEVAAGSTGTLPLDIKNISTDPNGGNHTLTDLTLLHAIITGPDAALFSLAGFIDGTVLANMSAETLSLLVHFDPTEDSTGVKYATLTFLTDQDAPFGQAGKEFSFDLQGTVVPEPGSLALLGLAGICLAGYTWKRRQI